MSTFITKTINYIIKNYNIKNLIFIVPNINYYYLFISLYIKINKDIFLPKIYTLLEIMEIISGISLIEENLLELYFYEILNKKVLKKDLLIFLEKNIIQILQDFNDIDINYVNNDIFFKNIISYSEIDILKYKNNNISFWKIIFECYYELKEKLLNKKMAYKGLIFREANNNIINFLKKNHNIEKLIFINIISNNNSELNLIKKLLSINKAKFYLDIDKYYYDNKINETGNFIKKKLIDLNLKNKKNIKWIFNDYSKYKKIKIIGSSGQISQIKIANEIIGTIKKEKLYNTVVIIPDDNINIIPIIYSMSNKLGILNINLSFSLNISTLSNSYLLLFELFCNREIKKLNGFFIDDILSLINDNYFRVYLKDLEIDFLKKMKKNIILDREIRIFIKKNKILDILNEKNIILNNFLSILILISKKFKKLLLNNNKYESYIDLIFIEYFTNWIKKIRLIISKKFNIIFSIERLLMLYKNWLKITKAVIYKNNKKYISLMDIFNASFFSFENVIIISGNEGRLPPKNYKQSFIPYNLSKEFKIFDNKEEYYIYTYHFYLLIQRSKNIFFIYDNNPKGIFLGEKSRFIYQIIHESIHKIDIINNYNNKKLDINKKNITRIVIKKNKLIGKKINNFFLYKGISPSSINLYINNPIDFYINKILCIKENNYDFNKIGIIVHKTLEYLYKNYINFKLNLYIIEKMLLLLDNINFLKKININDIDNIYSVDYIIAKEYVRQIILLDKQSIIDGNNITIKKIEYQLSFFCVNYKIKIIGIIDRIDIFNGCFRIIDYKTGLIDKKLLKISSNNFIELLNNPIYNKTLQLMIYAKLWFFNNKNIDLVYPKIFSLKNINSLIIDNNLGISLEVIKKFSLLLISKLKEINNHNIPFIGNNNF